MLDALFTRIRALSGRRKLEDDLSEELAAHVALKQQHLEAEGLSAPEASRQARLSLGNPTMWKESTREQWTFTWLESRAAARASRLNLRSAPASCTASPGCGA